MKDPQFPQPDLVSRNTGVVHLEREADYLDKDPQVFLEQEVVKPLRDFRPQRMGASIVYRGERSDGQLAVFNKSFDEEFAHSDIAEKFDIKNKDNDGWYRFSNKKRIPSHKSELRCYLFAKCESVPKITKALLDGLGKFPSFFLLKMNTTADERLDNIVVYFTEDATKEEIDVLLGILDTVQKTETEEDVSRFGEWDIPTPFGVRILSSKSVDATNNKSIGSLSYFPLLSGSQKVYFENAQEAHSVMSGYAGKTPHTLLSSLSNVVRGNKSLAPKAIAERLSNIKFSVAGSTELPEHFSLIDLIRLCKNEVAKRI